MSLHSIDFYYDFGSPNAYLAWKAIQGTISRTGIVVHMKPVLIGGIFKITGNSPPWQLAANIKPKLSYMEIEIKRFIAEHHLTKFKFNKIFPMNTLLAMRGAIVSQELGIHNDYISSMFKSIWENNEDISKPENFIKLLNNDCIDGYKILKAANTKEIKEKLKELTGKSIKRGVFGLPTFFWKDEIYFGKECISQIEISITSDNK